MKAIVSVSQTSQGESVQLLGHGDTESSARIMAYAYTNHGHNLFDAEFKGGTLVNVSAALADLIVRADRWDDVFDEDGRLVESHASAAHMQLMGAYGRLYLAGNELRFYEHATQLR